MAELSRDGPEPHHEVRTEVEEMPADDAIVPCMSVREKYTNHEWETFIKQTEETIEVSNGLYPAPEIGSPAFAKTIDHTLLKLEARAIQFDELCAEARVDGFATVCVRPQFVRKCKGDLKGSNVKIASVIGFHEGTYDLYHKLQETEQSLQDGADELDVVVNYPELKAGKYTSIYKELTTLRLRARHPVSLKLILETSQLDRVQIIAGCVMAAAANFDFVKTSTGFKGPGATEDNVRLMAACCDALAAGNEFGSKMQVKAAGGIRTLEDAVMMLEAGATRLGTSGGVWIAKEAKESIERSVSPPGAFDRRGSRPGLATRLFTDY